MVNFEKIYIVRYTVLWTNFDNSCPHSCRAGVPISISNSNSNLTQGSLWKFLFFSQMVFKTLANLIFF